MYRITFKTTVCAPQPAVWERVSTMLGVNDELRPLMQMTCPDMNMRISRDLIGTPGVPLFRSWLLLFGIIPIDYDDICLVAVIEGKSFSERSSMALMTQWHHDRVLEAGNEGTIITDELAFTPRFRIFGCVLSLVVRFLFMHRHRRLVSRFGSLRETVCQQKTD